MSISALDKNTVKLISTTQVITSVASAAKELIENALDAGAKSVEVNLVDNGASLIEVKDDGFGISKLDAPYVALSSYTSKIVNFSDLEALETYGFRGEALYALSAVSDLTIITRTKEDEVAASYAIDHSGCITKSEPCHRANGTTVQVRQLFKQVPVRRQLITNSKKANQDIKTLETFIKSYAICKFSVRISYKVNSNVVFAKPGMAALEEAASYILGKKVTSNMNWIEKKEAEMNMKLMVPRKGTHNVSDVFLPGAQYIFVNNRPIKQKDLEKILIKAIIEALGLDSSSRKKPAFILYILTDAGNIDVNLDPNKTSILFREQQLILNTVDKWINDFYGIQRETETQSVCDKSINEYQDCTPNADVENEWQACKKRKLNNETTDKICEKDASSAGESCNNTNEKLGSVNCDKLNGDKEEQAVSKDSDKIEQNAAEFNIQLLRLDLSDSDTNDSQNFTLVCNSSNESRNPNNGSTSKYTDDSPPLELSQSQTLSQLPVVDLGEDFDWDDSSTTRNADMNEKENKENNVNIQKESKSNKKKSVTLDEWSKGHVPGLKGGTDIRSYAGANCSESVKDDSHNSNVCAGFRKFSKQQRQQVIEQNPTMSAPQIAEAISNRWKKLSAEERGYYRDIARDEQMERDVKKQEATEKKYKKRILTALEKMKTMNPERKENLLLRTIVPWDMDLTRVTESFHDNKCQNKSLVVGSIGPNLWIVYKSAHLWILDAMRLKKELNSFDENTDTAEGVEELLKQWFLLKDDLSLLHPIHSLTQNRSRS